MQTIEPKSSLSGYVPSALTGLSVVSISDSGRSYGLYRVKQVEARTLVLGHGAFSFPVGMHLDVEDFRYQIPNANSFHQRATVVRNDREGIWLV